MKETTCKKLQEIGAFALAGGCTRKRMKQVVEMIRAARNYRWVAVYKIVKDEFVILADTGNEPPAYPRFPIKQGLCGAALDSGKPIIVGDVHKDVRFLPAFHTTRSEIDFRPSCVKRWQITHIFVHVTHDDRLARVQCSAAQSLFNRETWICRRLVPGIGENHKFIFDDFVNCYPTVIARRANHLHDLLHPLASAAACQRECADLLQLLA